MVLVSLLVALAGPTSVFELVTLAWGLMMTCFAPLMVARVRRWDISFEGYLTACLLGIGAMLFWKYALGLGDAVYEGAVGFVVSMPIITLLGLRGSRRSGI